MPRLACRPEVLPSNSVFGSAFGLAMRNLEGTLKPAEQVTVRAELKNIGTILIRDEEGSEQSDSNPLRIKPKGVAVVVRVKGSSRTHKSLAAFVLEQPRVQQRRGDVWKRSAHSSFDMQKMNAIQVRNVGQTVERTPIRCSNIDIVMACIRQGGTEAAENCLRNAIGRGSLSGRYFR